MEVGRQSKRLCRTRRSDIASCTSTVLRSAKKGLLPASFLFSIFFFLSTAVCMLVCRCVCGYKDMSESNVFVYAIECVCRRAAESLCDTRHAPPHAPLIHTPPPNTGVQSLPPQQQMTEHLCNTPRQQQSEHTEGEKARCLRSATTPRTTPH